MKRYLSMLYREKNYLRVQELSMDLLSIDMYESEVHYHLIKAMLMSGSKALSQIYFRQAEPYLTDEHMQEVKTLLHHAEHELRLLSVFVTVVEIILRLFCLQTSRSFHRRNMTSEVELLSPAKHPSVLYSL